MRHVSEFKEKLNPDKVASTAKMEPKQINDLKKTRANKLYELDQIEPLFGELEVVETIDPFQFYCHILPNHYT